MLNELAEKLQESCFAAVLDGVTTVYVARASARRVINVGINVGHRAPAYAGSTGRVLLSGLSERELDGYIAAVKLEKFTPHTVTSKVKLRDIIDETRRQGWSIVNEELELGLRSISVPIRDRAGDVTGAAQRVLPLGAGDAGGHAHAHPERAAGVGPAHLARAAGVGWAKAPAHDLEVSAAAARRCGGHAVCRRSRAGKALPTLRHRTPRSATPARGRACCGDQPRGQRPERVAGIAGTAK